MNNNRPFFMLTIPLILGLFLALILPTLAKAQKAVANETVSVVSGASITHRSLMTKPQTSNAILCYATIDAVTVYSSTDAAALQTAVDAAADDDLLKVAGTCAGVQVVAGITQTVYISKNITLQGGYTTTNWLAAPDPDTYPTTLDASRGGRVVAVMGPHTVTLDSLTITGADYDGLGGGIYNDISTLTITNTRVISNIARLVNSDEDLGGRGGGLGNEAGTIYIYNSEFEDNWAQEHGGAIKHHDGQISIANSIFNLNTVLNGDGGALDTGWDVSTIVTITNSIFTNNKVGDDGGAIYINNDSFLTVSDSIFSSNQAADKGGAIICSVRATCEIDDSTIANNIAGNGGGGLYVNWNTTHVYASNSTVSGNQVLTSTETLENGGGGIKVNSGGLTLTHMTIANNSTPNLSGKDGILVSDGSLTISNSLIAYNGQGLPGATNCQVESAGSMTSDGYNLSSDTSCTLLTAMGDITNTDPLIGPLSDNGGSTWTHALLTGSPAVDQIPQGSNGCGLGVDTDQRGIARPQNTSCDIGAFEARSFTLDVSLAGTGDGSVSGTGISCGVDCTESYLENTVLTLTASADAGSIFTGWSGACTNTSGTCVVTMDAAKSVTATFTLEDVEYHIFLPIVMNQ